MSNGMPIRPSLQLLLVRRRSQRVTVSLTHETHLALFHYCLACGADALSLSRAAAAIIGEFLARDPQLKRWRAAQGTSLPTNVPRHASRGGRRA